MIRSAYVMITVSFMLFETYSMISDEANKKEESKPATVNAETQTDPGQFIPAKICNPNKASIIMTIPFGNVGSYKGEVKIVPHGKGKVTTFTRNTFEGDYVDGKLQMNGNQKVARK